MEINHRQQDKFSTKHSTLWIELIDGSQRDIDFVEIEKAIKDFCFIRHELSNYSYLYASQLSFDIHLILPYWEYLFVNGQINEGDKDELEEGALLTIYLYFKEIYEEEGWCFLYKHKLFETLQKTLDTYIPDKVKKRELVEKIKFIQIHYSNEKLGDQYSQKLDKEEEILGQTLTKNDEWVYYEFVEKYYMDLANSFEPLREKTKSFFDNIQNGKRE